MNDQGIQQPHDLTHLLADGDAACAEGRAGRLAEVAHLLAPCVAVPQQLELDRIARLADIDFGAACAAWDRVTADLLSHGIAAARGAEQPTQLAAR